MVDPTTATLRFHSPAGLPLEAAFDAGRLTSDGGLPWLAEADGQLGLCEALAAEGPEWRRGPVRDGVPEHILLDLDGTDDPAHGDQEGVRYHGYYRQHMYHPLLIFDGTTDQLIAAVLRPGNAHGS